MKSIRRQITSSFLVGFSLWLGAGGAVLYFFTRGMLRDQFDGALRSEALAMAAATKQDGMKIEFEFADKIRPNKRVAPVTKFYQLWLIDGASLGRSRTLGDTNLPQEFGPLQDPKCFNLDLPKGLKGRAVGVRFFPEPEREPDAQHRATTQSKALEVGLVIAADRSVLERAISSLGAIILLSGAVTLLATIAGVALVVRRCLAPLNRVAEQAVRINASSLQTRFPVQGMPAELDPICHRLNDLLGRLESSFNDINEYAAKVAHELRTPLSILRLKLEQAGGRLPPDFAEELHTEIHQLTHVVDQSLLIAKAEQGRLLVRTQTFDLAALVAEVGEDFSLLAQEEGRRVSFKQPALCEVTADPKHARQIIHNLLSNALKHGHGDIRLKVARHGGGGALTIFNPVRREPIPAQPTLGLGLRVVDSLLLLLPGVKCRRRRGKHYYAVQLRFPAIAASGMFPQGAPRETADSPSPA